MPEILKLAFILVKSWWPRVAVRQNTRRKSRPRPSLSRLKDGRKLKIRDMLPGDDFKQIVADGYFDQQAIGGVINDGFGFDLYRISYDEGKNCAGFVADCDDFIAEIIRINFSFEQSIFGAAFG